MWSERFFFGVRELAPAFALGTALADLRRTLPPHFHCDVESPLSTLVAVQGGRKSGSKLPHSKCAGAEIVCYNSRDFRSRTETHGSDEESW